MKTATGAAILLAVLAVIACSTPSEPSAVTAAWESSGDWGRNEYAERGFAENLRRQDIRAESIKMASLDSPVISPDRDAFITFGCIDGLSVVHILSYTDKLPAGETEYAFGLFGVGATSPDDVFSHTDLANVGEVAGDYRIVITEPARINSILEMLRTAAGMPDKFVGLDVQRRNEVLRATFEPTGIEDALHYLGCFE